MPEDAVPRGAPRGASSVEVYGFVGWIASAVTFGELRLLQVPLQAGITYYPSKEWALIIPSYLLASVVFVYWVYESLNMMSVPPPASLTTVYDANSKWVTQLGMPSAAASTQHSIPPLVHLPPHLASGVLHGGHNFQGGAQQTTPQAVATQGGLTL
ncbi:PIG-P-domain-containing protein [Scenedesmus sp. NREL 46B-D3]|nr:PIG-P-domain-containing protein [Scenedesmus sp. NREL 46B-D3]